MVCKNCGANIPNGELFCPNCGTCTENAKFCKYCGAVIGADCVVCPACGRQVEPLQSAQQPQPVYVNNNVTYGGVAKSKWAAFFLCLFLGLIGAHKFYVGKIGMGVYISSPAACSASARSSISSSSSVSPVPIITFNFLRKAAYYAKHP